MKRALAVGRPLAVVPVLSCLIAAGCSRTSESPPPPATDTTSPAARASAEPPTASRPDGERPVEEVGPTEPLRADLAPFFEMIGQGQFGPARVRIRKHLLEHEDDGQAHFLFGLTYHREKRYAQAIPHFDRAIELAPRFDAAHYFRAWAAYYSGDLPRARTGFERHLAFRPDAADSHFGLGLVDLEEDRLDDAAARFRRAIDLNQGTIGAERDLAKARVRLADVHQLRGEFAAARQELELAIALWPDHDEAFYKLFRVCTRLGDEEAAEAALLQFEAARLRKAPGTRFPE